MKGVFQALKIENLRDLFAREDTFRTIPHCKFIDI